jgi:hypothetical protein
MPFTKSWKRHETAAVYQATRHNLDNITYQPLAPEVAAWWAERVPAERRPSRSARRGAVTQMDEQLSSGRTVPEKGQRPMYLVLTNIKRLV